MKACTRCGIERDLGEFYADRRATDGRTSACKACLNRDIARYQRAHSEDIARRQRAWYLKNRVSVLLRSKAYAEANKDQVSALKRKWAEENRQQVLVAGRAWKKRNPHFVAFHKQKHHAKKRGIEFLFTFEEWMRWWGSDLGRRGRGADDLCMGRYADEGSYERGNVYKVPMSENKAGPRPLPVPDW